MTTKKTNRDLARFYDTVYRKGEGRHYTKLISQVGNLPDEELEVLATVSWEGKRVLDVGCGTGLLVERIAELGASEVTGIDFSEEAIRTAAATRSHQHARFVEQDLFAHQGTYDVVVSLGTIEHMDDPFEALRHMKELLAPGGTIIVTCPNWLNPRGYVLQTLAQLFNAPITLADLHYLTPVEFEEFARRLHMKVSWRTFDQDWAHGRRLILDFRRRLPNVLVRDMKMAGREQAIEGFVRWLETHVLAFDHTTHWSGATAIYELR